MRKKAGSHLPSEFVAQQTKGFWRKEKFPLVVLSWRCYVNVPDPLVGGVQGRKFGVETMGGNEKKWGKGVRRGHKLILARRPSLQTH